MPPPPLPAREHQQFQLLSHVSPSVVADASGVPVRVQQLSTILEDEEATTCSNTANNSSSSSTLTANANKSPPLDKFQAAVKAGTVDQLLEHTDAAGLERLVEEVVAERRAKSSVTDFLNSILREVTRRSSSSPPLGEQEDEAECFLPGNYLVQHQDPWPTPHVESHHTDQHASNNYQYHLQLSPDIVDPSLLIHDSLQLSASFRGDEAFGSWAEQQQSEGELVGTRTSSTTDAKKNQHRAPTDDSDFYAPSSTRAVDVNQLAVEATVSSVLETAAQQALMQLGEDHSLPVMLPRSTPGSSPDDDDRLQVAGALRLGQNFHTKTNSSASNSASLDDDISAAEELVNQQDHDDDTIATPKQLIEKNPRRRSLHIDEVEEQIRRSSGRELTPGVADAEDAQTDQQNFQISPNLNDAHQHDFLVNDEEDDDDLSTSLPEAVIFAPPSRSCVVPPPPLPPVLATSAPQHVTSYELDQTCSQERTACGPTSSASAAQPACNVAVVLSQPNSASSAAGGSRSRGDSRVEIVVMGEPPSMPVTQTSSPELNNEVEDVESTFHSALAPVSAPGAPATAILSDRPPHHQGALSPSRDHHGEYVGSTQLLQRGHVHDKANGGSPAPLNDHDFVEVLDVVPPSSTPSLAEKAGARLQQEGGRGLSTGSTVSSRFERVLAEQEQIELRRRFHTRARTRGTITGATASVLMQQQQQQPSVGSAGAAAPRPSSGTLLNGGTAPARTKTSSPGTTFAGILAANGTQLSLQQDFKAENYTSHLQHEQVEVADLTWSKKHFSNLYRTRVLKKEGVKGASTAAAASEDGAGRAGVEAGATAGLKRSSSSSSKTSASKSCPSVKHFFKKEKDHQRGPATTPASTSSPGGNFTVGVPAGGKRKEHLTTSASHQPGVHPPSRKNSNPYLLRKDSSIVEEYTSLIGKKAEAESIKKLGSRMGRKTSNPKVKESSLSCTTPAGESHNKNFAAADDGVGGAVNVKKNDLQSSAATTYTSTATSPHAVDPGTTEQFELQLPKKFRDVIQNLQEELKLRDTRIADQDAVISALQEEVGFLRSSRQIFVSNATAEREIRMGADHQLHAEQEVEATNSGVSKHVLPPENISRESPPATEAQQQGKDREAAIASSPPPSQHQQSPEGAIDASTTSRALSRQSSGKRLVSSPYSGRDLLSEAKLVLQPGGQHNRNSDHATLSDDAGISSAAGVAEDLDVSGVRKDERTAGTAGTPQEECAEVAAEGVVVEKNNYDEQAIARLAHERVQKVIERADWHTRQQRQIEMRSPKNLQLHKKDKNKISFPTAGEKSQSAADTAARLDITQGGATCSTTSCAKLRVISLMSPPTPNSIFGAAAAPPGDRLLAKAAVGTPAVDVVGAESSVSFLTKSRADHAAIGAPEPNPKKTKNACSVDKSTAVANMNCNPAATGKGSNGNGTGPRPAGTRPAAVTSSITSAKSGTAAAAFSDPRSVMRDFHQKKAKSSTAAPTTAGMESGGRKTGKKREPPAGYAAYLRNFAKKLAKEGHSVF